MLLPCTTAAAAAQLPSAGDGPSHGWLLLWARNSALNQWFLQRQIAKKRREAIKFHAAIIEELKSNMYVTMEAFVFLKKKDAINFLKR